MDAWTPQRRCPLRHPPRFPGRVACSRSPIYLFTIPIQVFTMPIWPFTIPIRVFTMLRGGRSRWTDLGVQDGPMRAAAHPGGMVDEGPATKATGRGVGWGGSGGPRSSLAPPEACGRYFWALIGAESGQAFYVPDPPKVHDSLKLLHG